MAKQLYEMAVAQHPVNEKQILDGVEDNYLAHLTPAGDELRQMLPDDLRRHGMSQLAAVVLLNKIRRERLH